MLGVYNNVLIRLKDKRGLGCMISKRSLDKEVSKSDHATFKLDRFAITFKPAQIDDKIDVNNLDRGSKR